MVCFVSYLNHVLTNIFTILYLKEIGTLHEIKVYFLIAKIFAVISTDVFHFENYL